MTYNLFNIFSKLLNFFFVCKKSLTYTFDKAVVLALTWKTFVCVVQENCWVRKRYMTKAAIAQIEGPRHYYRYVMVVCVLHILSALTMMFHSNATNA